MFQPGKSGNPSGRPKEDPELRELARQYTKAAIMRLAEIMEDRADNRASAAACSVLLDRGWGKPHQTAEVKITDERAETLSDNELAAIIAARRSNGAEKPKVLN